LTLKRQTSRMNIIYFYVLLI